LKNPLAILQYQNNLKFQIILDLLVLKK